MRNRSRGPGGRSLTKPSGALGKVILTIVNLDDADCLMTCAAATRLTDGSGETITIQGSSVAGYNGDSIGVGDGTQSAVISTAFSANAQHGTWKRR